MVPFNKQYTFVLTINLRNIYIYTGGKSINMVVAVTLLGFMLHVWYMQQSSGHMYLNLQSPRQDLSILAKLLAGTKMEETLNNHWNA